MTGSDRRTRVGAEEEDTDRKRSRLYAGTRHDSIRRTAPTTVPRSSPVICGYSGNVIARL